MMFFVILIYLEHVMSGKVKTRSLMVTSRYCWNSSELEEIERASVLLAADVIYSNDLTDAFFRTLNKLMLLGSEKVLIAMVVSIIH